MQRVILGLAMSVFAGAAIVGGTGAFFSDTETSTGNTFTAGAIDLTVDSQQHYNHMVCTPGQAGSTWQPEVGFKAGPDQYPVAGTPCSGTWSATNLGPTFKFFNFGDVKPADQGEDTVSLHIDNNPAWACVDIKTTANDENTLIEPEASAGDVSTTTGELAQNIKVFAWLDNANASSTKSAHTPLPISQANKGPTISNAPNALAARPRIRSLVLFSCRSINKNGGANAIASFCCRKKIAVNSRPK